MSCVSKLRYATRVAQVAHTDPVTVGGTRKKLARPCLPMLLISTRKERKYNAAPPKEVNPIVHLCQAALLFVDGKKRSLHVDVTV